jgi:hypothetical protein
MAITPPINENAEKRLQHTPNSRYSAQRQNRCVIQTP